MATTCSTNTGVAATSRPSGRTNERTNGRTSLRGCASADESCATCSSNVRDEVSSPPPTSNRYLKCAVPSWLSCHWGSRIVSTWRPTMPASMNALVLRPTTTAL
jgi:hypothetical protein